MQKNSKLVEYEKERCSTLRLNYPYGVIVRESDGKILFFNRDYAPLQKTFIKVPESIVKKITAQGDMNGTQWEGFKTYWFYKDGSSPANFIGSDTEKNFIWQMMMMGRMLLPYGYNPEMYFAEPGRRGDDWTKFE